MGVTLERVQNKFACIIGELCSEPDILSQFAIWLDLRLAEYKAKGAISLEHFGEDPNPEWLRGHKLPKGAMSFQITTTTESPSRRHTCDDLDNRMSPDVVFVPDDIAEISDERDVFAVNIQSNGCMENKNNGCHTRKRTAVGESDSFDFQSPLVKCARRITSSDDFSCCATGTNSSYRDELTDGFSANSMFESTSVESSEYKIATNSCQERDSCWDVSGQVQPSLPTGLYPQRYPERYSYKNIRTRVPDAAGKTQQTVSHIVKAVATVERWLWTCFAECRHMEEIPPEKLDEYLEGFFPILKKPSGEEYEAHSLTKFRSYLNRFLKESDYPVCICSSPIFAKSQKAFYTRRKQLFIISEKTAGCVRSNRTISA